uniref:Putative secreted protein n=1 Tax=Ixodes ricinus TaxID=34613 RepID=A0A6B0V5B3_IXORI
MVLASLSSIFSLLRCSASFRISSSSIFWRVDEISWPIFRRIFSLSSASFFSFSSRSSLRRRIFSSNLFFCSNFSSSVRGLSSSADSEKLWWPDLTAWNSTSASVRNLLPHSSHLRLLAEAGEPSADVGSGLGAAALVGSDPADESSVFPATSSLQSPFSVLAGTLVAGGFTAGTGSLVSMASSACAKSHSIAASTPWLPHTCRAFSALCSEKPISLRMSSSDDMTGPFQAYRTCKSVIT